MDNREFQHGIDFVPLQDGSKYMLIWASSGIPPEGASATGDWTHDIYYSFFDVDKPVIRPQLLISNSEAQEPASSAITSDGRIMVTMEDGWNAKRKVAQRFGIYDPHGRPVDAYPRLVQDGGHSGHVAAVSNLFVVFYSEGWVDGGGVDNLGSGDDVMARVYGSDGEFQREISVAVGSSTRDWWPLIAGSADHACLVWQRVVKSKAHVELMYSIFDPKTGYPVKHSIKIEDKVKYYTYSVKYIDSLDSFLILGSYESGKGFAYLVDNEGTVRAKNTAIPSIVRESKPAVKAINGKTFIVQQMAPSGIMVLLVANSSITLATTVHGDIQWQGIGSDGLFLDDNDVFFAALSHSGLKTVTYENVLPVVRSGTSSFSAPIGSRPQRYQFTH